MAHREPHSRLTKWAAIASIIAIPVAIIAIARDYYDVTDEPSRPTVPSGPYSAPPPYPTSAPVAEPDYRHRGRLNIYPGETANLDSPQDAYDWQFDDGSADELTYSAKDGLIVNSGGLVAIRKQRATYDTCSSVSGYAPGTVSRGDLISGDSLCVQTSEGRIATVYIVGARDDLIALQVEVYELP